MSQRPPWWTYIKSVIREYPKLCKQLETPLEAKITPVYDQIGGRPQGTISRPTENAVIHNLPPNDQRKYDAVAAALHFTKNLPDGAERMTTIELVYFKKTHTLDGAAVVLNVHRNTTGRWNGDFIRLVAEKLDIP